MKMLFMHLSESACESMTDLALAGVHNHNRFWRGPKPGRSPGDLVLAVSQEDLQSGRDAAVRAAHP